jgi:signal transduction histidine kinase
MRDYGSTDIDAAVAAVGRIDAVPLILEVICRTTGMGFAAIASVTEDRWVACSVRDTINFGLTPGAELKVETTICDQIRDTGEMVVIEHATQDTAYCHHPTPALYGFESYVSVPIRRTSGAFFGTLCAIDPRPAQVNTPQTIGMFTLFAELIACQLDSQDRIEHSEAALDAERETSDLREQFIAVLGHDLRNPLAAIDAGARRLLRQNLDDTTSKILGLMQGSVKRMTHLIDSVTDFARGHLGGGLILTCIANAPLQEALQQVVAEIRSASPDRVIETAYGIDHPVACDTARVAQLLSNLLANAVTHGDPDGPIKVAASTGDGILEISVSNPGDPIPAAALSRLFQPFYRASAQSAKNGLGLGLYIAAMIAKAHDGTLAAASSAAEIRFVFRMPTERCNK